MTAELALVLATLLCCASIAVGVAAFLYWRKAQGEAEVTVALCNRFPLLLKMDKLTDHDLLALVNDAPDDILQAAALGIAALASKGNAVLEELVSVKASFLSGDMTEGQMQEAIADAMTEASYTSSENRKDFSPRERAAYSGVSLNGAAAFATSLRHIVEAYREERRSEAAASQGA